jgi:hypothetical protein
MSRRIYVASSWRNPLQPGVVEALRAAGHEVYDFRNPKPGNTGFSWRQILPDPPPWSAEATRRVLEHPIAKEGFDLDFSAMRWADTFVMLQPCGRSAALELGWAVGAGRQTFVLLADGQEPELMLKCAGPSINEVRAAMGKEPLIDGHLTVAEYAEKNRLILNEGQAELLVSEACP